LWEAMRAWMKPERANGAAGSRALLRLDLPAVVGPVSLSVSGKEDFFVHTLNGGGAKSRCHHVAVLTGRLCRRAANYRATL
jgi:hypothetical protein